MSLPAEKRCPRCDTVKPAKDYHSRPTRNGRQLKSYCKDCDREWQRERRKRPDWHLKLAQRRKREQEYRDRNRESVRTYSREYERWRRNIDPEYRERRNASHRAWKERVKRDPERREYQRRMAREQYAIRRDRQGRAPRVASRPNHKADMLPIEPFREWLRWFMEQERDIDQPADKVHATVYARIAWAIGVSEQAANRAVYRWLNESEMVPLDKADALLTRLDSPARLYELWPELAEVEECA